LNFAPFFQNNFFEPFFQNIFSPIRYVRTYLLISKYILSSNRGNKLALLSK
jgi:hypothetical protein